MNCPIMAGWPRRCIASPRRRDVKRMTRIEPMNFASDGVDEASSAATTGDIVRSARTMVAIVIEKMADDLQVNAPLVRLNLF